MTGHGRFIRVDESINHRWTRHVQGLTYNHLSFRWIIKTETCNPTGTGEHHKINRMKVYSVFRISLDRDLLPFDHAKTIVLKNNDLDRKIIFGYSGQFAHQHGKTTVPAQTNDLAARISHSC